MSVIGSDLEIFEDVDLVEQTQDPNSLVHIINPARNIHAQVGYMEAQQIVDRARKLGIELNALCGAKFIPSKDPGDLDMCKACIDVAGDIMREDG